MLTVYKASAGSGKTFTLAKNYITLLIGIKNPSTDKYALNLTRLDDGTPKLKYTNRHRGILAITFTHKATEEMKTRIIKELRLLSVLPTPGEEEPSAYAEDLGKDLACSRQDLADAASLALRQLLFDYHNFHVSTIDSFFQRVLRAFARELDRQDDYNVELDTANVMNQAVGTMLDSFNAHSDNIALEKWLCSFMESQVDKGAKANFFNRSSSLFSSLVKLVEKINMESFKDYAEKMEAYLQTDRLQKFEKTLHDFKIYILNDIKTEAEALFTGPNAISIDEAPTADSKKAIPFFLEGTELRSFKVFTGEVKTNQQLCDPEVGYKDMKRWTGVSDEHKSAIKAFFERTYSKYLPIISLSPLREALSQLNLLQHAWKFLRQLLADNNALLISDTNDLLSRIIGDDDTPFIYERMGVELRHYLIDEFQDTSKMQWSNLRPLVANGLSEKHDSLVIGDEKQSIYRFRNSDSSILHSQIQKDFDGRIIPRGSEPKENTNYRSSVEVVMFNNTFFSTAAELKKISGYENVVQDIPEKHLNFHGHVKFIDAREYDKNDVFDQMAQEILRLTSEGRYSFRDIVILLNKNDQAVEVAEFLIKNYSDSIPLASDEALLLSSSWAVQLVISVLRMIDNEDSATPDDLVKSKYLSRAQVQTILNSAIYFLHSGHSVNESIDMAMQCFNGQCDSTLTEVVAKVREKRPATLVAMIETVIESQFADEKVRGDQSAYLSALLDEAIDFCARTDGGLHAFIQWWDEKKDKLKLSGNFQADAVRIMTIHKSKGLEFPCVLIPLCNWAETSHKDSAIWTDRLIKNPPKGLDITDAPPALFVTLAAKTRVEGSLFYPDYIEEREKSRIDTLNKTYVAFTRAAAELIVWYAKDAKDNEKKKDDKKGVKDYIFDLITEVFKKGTPSPEKVQGVEDLVLHLRAFNAGGNLEIGEPTRKSDDDIKKAQEEHEKASQAMHIDYPVICREDAMFVTAIDDGRELERDIDDVLPDQPRTQKQQQGIIFHDMMAYVRTVADVDDAVDRIASANGMESRIADRYRQIIKNFISLPQAKQWFEGYKKVYIEQPIYVSHIDKVKRPDRVIVLPNGDVHVIDYKFTDEDENVGAESQVSQIRLYKRLLQEMGYKKVTAFLCYPRLATILKC